MEKVFLVRCEQLNAKILSIHKRSTDNINDIYSYFDYNKTKYDELVLIDFTEEKRYTIFLTKKWIRTSFQKPTKVTIFPTHYLNVMRSNSYHAFTGFKE